MVVRSTSRAPVGTKSPLVPFDVDVAIDDIPCVITQNVHEGLAPVSIHLIRNLLPLTVVVC